MSVERHTPERQRLLLLVESNLFFLVKAEMTLDEAKDMQQRLSKPLGILNSRFGFRSSNEAKQIARQGHAQMSVDITRGTK